MDARPFTELLVELFRRLNHRSPDPDVIEAIQQIQEDNGLSEEGSVPEWLSSALGAALAGRDVQNALFQEIGSDVGSFLIEVSEIIPGWEHDDQGEWVTMRFPALEVEILLSREAVSPEGAGCCSYSVRHLSAPG